MDAFQILGEQIVSEAEGRVVSSVGAFDPSFLVSAAAELAKGGIAEHEKSVAEDKTKVDVQKAVDANAAWANAESVADTASPAQKSAAQALASSAMSRAMSARAGLSPADVQKVCAQATDSAEKAAHDSLASPSNPSATARMHAWQKVAASCGGGLAQGAGGAMVPYGGGKDGGNFFTKAHAGVPTYVWIGGGVLGLTGFILLIKSLIGKRK